MANARFGQVRGSIPGPVADVSNPMFAVHIYSEVFYYLNRRQMQQKINKHETKVQILQWN